MISLPKGTVDSKGFYGFRKCLHCITKKIFTKCYETQRHQLLLRMSLSANHWKPLDYIVTYILLPSFIFSFAFKCKCHSSGHSWRQSIGFEGPFVWFGRDASVFLSFSECF